MKVTINAGFEGYVEVDTVTAAVEWHVTEPQEFDDPWITVKDGDTVLADDHISDVKNDSSAYGETAHKQFEQALFVLGRGGYFPPYHANDAAVVAWTTKFREERKENLIRMIEGGNTHAISVLKQEFNIDVKLRVEVVEAAA